MLGSTHWAVYPWVAAIAADTVGRFGGSWNTYAGHGIPSGHVPAQTVDYWNPGGRGDPLDEHRGDMIVAWTLGQNEIQPIELLIWWSWWWRPGIGWKPYGGLHGNHGPGADAHVHVVYRDQ